MKDVPHLLAIGVAKVGLMSGKGTLVRFFAICLLFGIAAYEVVSFAFVLRAGCLGCNDVYAWREIASGASVSHVICDNPAFLSSCERSELIEISWETMPIPVRAVSALDLNVITGVVASSAFINRELRAAFYDAGFRPIASNEYAMAWSREDVSDRYALTSLYSSVTCWQEARGVVCVAVLILIVWCLSLRNVCDCLSRGCVLEFFVVMFFLCVAALSHTLLPPNGLGVYGGKAKLIFLNNGIPPCGWLTDFCYSVFQPAYPPGLAVLTYLAFTLSNGCGDFLIQLLPVVAMALVACEVALAHKGRWVKWASLLLVFAPAGVKTATCFYAEPFSALLFLSGCRLMREGREELGWLVAGAAAFFRPEAWIFVVALWVSDRPSIKKLPQLCKGLFATMVWMAVIVCCDGFLPDFRLMNFPDISNIMKALEVAIETGCWYLLSIVSLLLLCGCNPRYREVVRGILFAGCSLLMVAVAYGFRTSIGIDWAIANTMPRIIWVVFAIIVGR